VWTWASEDRSRALACHPERMRGIAPCDVSSRSLFRRKPERSLTAFGMTITPTGLPTPDFPTLVTGYG
jgi:hypothetical protein